MNQVILITGVGGFIGSNLAKYFNARAYKIYGVDILQPENISVALNEYFQRDLVACNVNELLLKVKPDLIFHCAGKASVAISVSQPGEDFRLNVLMTQKILEAVRETEINAKFVYFSSAAVYGNPVEKPVNEQHLLNPISPYGFHKMMGEELCKEYTNIFNLKTCIVRIFSAYGIGLRRQVIWDIIRKSLLDEKVMLYGSGMESRDFINIKDICLAIELIIKNSKFNSSVFNLANGEEITIDYLANTLRTILNIKKEIEFSKEVIKGNPLNWVSDITKLKAIGYKQQIDIEQGLIQLSEWAKSEITNI